MLGLCPVLAVLSRLAGILDGMCWVHQVVGQAGDHQDQPLGDHWQVLCSWA